MTRQPSGRRRNTRDHNLDPIPNTRKRPARRDDQRYQTYEQPKKKRKKSDPRLKREDSYERRRRTRRELYDDYEDSYQDRYQKQPVDRRRDFYDYRNEDYQSRQSYAEKNVSSKKPKTPGQLIFSFVWTIVFYTMTIGVICAAIMFSFSSKSNSSIFGYRFYTVLTDSMAPQKDGPDDGFYSGDMVILKMMDGKNAKEGDIVTFRVGESGYLTHRVVETLDELNGEKDAYVITKGDANNTNDPPVKAENIVGKVIYSIPKVGLIMEFIREQIWACLVCVLSLYGFILVLKAYFFAPEQEKIVSKRNSREASY